MERHDRYSGHAAVRGTQPWRRRRGFTLIEVVFAMALFAGVVTVLAATISTSVASRQQLTNAAEINRMLDQLADTAATLPYEQLAGNSFVPPERCPSTNSVGARAVSCTRLLGRDFRVNWSVQTQAVSATGSAVLLTATTTDPQSDINYRSVRTVRSNGSGAADGSSLVRVRLQGTGSALSTMNSPVLLLSGPTMDNIVAGGVPDSAGVATFKVDPWQCQAADPCRVGLRTGSLRGYNDTHVLGTDTVVGNNTVVTEEGILTDVVVPISTWGPQKFLIEAYGSSTASLGTGGQQWTVAAATQAGPEPGSVCVWFTFAADAGLVNVPGCNFTDNGLTIELPMYAPGYDYIARSGASDVLLPIADGYKVGISGDAPGQTNCPVVAGQRFFEAGAWQTVGDKGVCSSWTWGLPSELRTLEGTKVGDIGAFAPLFTTSTQDRASGGIRSIVWTGANGRFDRPAVGGPNEAVWAAPRDASGCPEFISGASCAPGWINGDTTPPEEYLNGCTPASIRHCLSNSAGRPFIAGTASGDDLALTRGWPYPLVVDPSAPTPIRIRVGDVATRSFPAAAAVTVKVTNMPAGDLRYCNPACAGFPGAGVTVPLVSGFGTFDLEFTPGTLLNSAYVDDVTFTIADANGTSTVTVPLVVSPSSPAVAIAFDAIVGQDGSATPTNFSPSPVVVIGADGERAHGAVLAIVDASPVAANGATSPGAFEAMSTTSQGVARFGFNGRNLDAGPFTNVTIDWLVDGTATASGVVTATQRVATIPRAGNVTSLTSPTTWQGQSTPIEVTVVDVTGEPIAGVPVQFDARRGELAVNGITFKPAVCVTASNGQCSVTQQTAPSAEAGAWQLSARAGSGATGTSTGQVNVLPYWSADVTNVPQGGSAQMVVTMTDSGGRPIPNGEFYVSAPPGTTVFPTYVTATDNNGQATLTITAGVDEAPGFHQLNFTTLLAVGADRQVDFEVIAQPKVFEWADGSEVQVSAGGANVVTGHLEGTGGIRLSGVAVEVVSSGTTNGVRVSSGITSDAAGGVALWVVADDDATGQSTFEVRYGDQLLETLQVTVTP